MTTSMTPDQRLAHLRESDAAGQPPDNLAFWGHQPERDGSFGRGCLSQWWSAPFSVDGAPYATAGNHAKFSQHPVLGDFLRRTGQKVLVEASPYYRIWGIGLAPTHDDVARPTRWRGPNLLGFALMDVRDRL